MQYQKIACDGNIYHACANLGIMYEEGQGVRQDSNKALWLFTKACDGKYTRACSSAIGVMYEHGQGVNKDMIKAADIIARRVIIKIGMVV